MPENLQAIARFLAFGSLEERQLTTLQSMAGEARALPRNAVLRHDGLADQPLFLLIKGWAASFITFSSGERQMLKVYLPGDLIGFPSLAVVESPDSVVALTEIEVRKLSLKGLGRLFEQEPRVAAMMFLISQEERVEAMDRQALLARMHAPSRLAAFFLHLRRRVAPQNAHLPMKLDLPLTQNDLADLVGVTTVHMNRVIQQMRSDGVIKLSRKKLEIISLQKLISLTDLPLRKINYNPEWLPSN